MEGLEHGNFSRQDLGRMMQASMRANALSSSAAASTNNGAAAKARATGQRSSKKSKRHKKKKTARERALEEELASLYANSPEIPMHWYADPLPEDMILSGGGYRPTQLWGWRTDLENLETRCKSKSTWRCGACRIMLLLDNIVGCD